MKEMEVSAKSVNIPLRLAIIGLGGIGRIYTRAIAARDDLKVVAACDVFAKARAEYAREFSSIPLYTTVSEMLKQAEFDAAFVLTSDPCHAEPFIQCLEADKHVFVEKPVGNTVAEIKTMVAAMDRHANRVSASGHILRYYPVNYKIKQMALAGGPDSGRGRCYLARRLQRVFRVALTSTVSGICL